MWVSSTRWCGESFKRQQNNKSTRQKDKETKRRRDNMGRRFENLYVWQESRELINIIYKIMSSCRDYGFKDQIQRAAVSIMNNIAEGFESGSDAKFLNFLNISRGSCTEVRSMLYLCEDLVFCTKEEREQLQSQLRRITSGIVNLADSISKKDS